MMSVSGVIDVPKYLASSHRYRVVTWSRKEFIYFRHKLDFIRHFSIKTTTH